MLLHDPAEELFLALNPVIVVPPNGNELSESEVLKVLSDLNCVSVAIFDFCDQKIEEEDLLDRVEAAGIEMDGYLTTAEDNLNFKFGYE